MGLRAHGGLLLLTVLAVGCGSSETPAPSPSPLPKVVPAAVPPVVPPVVPVASGAFDPSQALTGTWKGFVRLTEPAGPPDDNYIVTFELRIDGTANAYTGRLQLFDLGARSEPMAADVRGSTRQDGFAAFTGSGSRSFPPSGASYEVTDLAVRTHVQSGLEGHMQVQETLGVSSSRRAWEIISATWQAAPSTPPVSPGAFQGLWRGLLNTTSCTGTCSFYPMATGPVQIDLTISQVGSTLTSHSPVSGGALTGDATGTTFVLRRNYERPNGCPPSAGFDTNIVCKESIEITGTLRPDGKLQAVMQDHREGVESRGPYTFTATFDLPALTRN